MFSYKYVRFILKAYSLGIYNKVKAIHMEYKGVHIVALSTLQFQGLVAKGYIY